MIARVLTLVCGGASIQPEYDDGCAGHSIIADLLMTAGVWDKRWKFRTGEAVYRARIIAVMAGTEAETELLGATEVADGDDRYQIDLMAEESSPLRPRQVAGNDTHAGASPSAPDRARCRCSAHRKRKLSGRQIDKLAGRSIADVPDRLPSYFRESG